MPKSSIFNLQSELMQGTKQQKEDEEQTVARRVDPNTESKLVAAKEGIIEFVASTRPRFKPFFEVMKFSSTSIEVVVPTQELEQEIRRNETELMSHIVELAHIDGFVELRVEVNEDEVRVKRPIKLEDRIVHFTNLNPKIIELTEALDLQVES